MPRKGGLGKGLDALIPGDDKQPDEGSVTYLPIDSIVPNPRQPRSSINTVELQELAESIREHGIIQPLIVSRENDGNHYVLIAGERRLEAARLAGLQSIPAILRQVGDQDRLELALIENVQRSDLLPLETAEAYRQLNEEFKLSHEEISRRVGKSRVSISNTLRLLKLPERIKTALLDGNISEGHARALLALTTAQAQIAVLDMIIRNSLNVRQTEELVRKYGGVRPAISSSNQSLSPELLEIEDRMRAALGTKVSLHPGKKGGSITIHYFSDEELNRLIDHILKG
ncbi:MAG: ParB/RepB/Spo0J family partition protein [Anaerolineaceae bacterium]|nr:ParB/RepB/Spo0J family partition protein [Anaerolineaceae bacterium]MBN2676747.1 ParB/RepB/Spo0J family partition protein [Anaerolineaceae bacterium]